MADAIEFSSRCRWARLYPRSSSSYPMFRNVSKYRLSIITIMNLKFCSWNAGSGIGGLFERYNMLALIVACPTHISS